MPSRYKIVSSFKEVHKLIEYCKETGYCSLDFETKAQGPHGPVTSKNGEEPTGPQYKEDEPTIIGISFQPGSGYSVPLFHKDSPFTRKEATKVLKLLGRELMENSDIIKIAFNLKFEYRWLRRYGITMRGRLFDAMLAKYLLDENPPSDLKSTVNRMLPEFAGYEDEVVKLVSVNRGWANIPLETLSEYCCLDCDLTLRLMLIFERKLIKKNFYNLFRNMCMMQTRVLAESESMGMLIDKPYLVKIEKEQRKQIEKNRKALLSHKKIKKFQKWRLKKHIKNLIKNTKKEIKGIRKGEIEFKNPEAAIRGREQKLSRYIAGELVTKKEQIDEEVNFNSPDQMIELLFNSPKGFNFDIIKYTKDKKTKQFTDRPSTDEEVLLELKLKDKSGFIDNLLSHRELTKLHSTYMVGILEKLTKENTLHCNYRIHGTVTGRLSSRNPNFQNFPRSTTSGLIKKMFVPPPGHLIMEIDYSQAELRVVAEIANDKAMIDIFKRGYNIHVATACKSVGALDRYDEVKNILKDENHPEEPEWTRLKKRAKVINFGILYQQSAVQLAGTLSEPGHPVSKEDAQRFKDEWLDMYPGVKKWFKKQEEFVKEHGYVYNIFGRKRRLESIWSNDRGVIGKAIRDAINAPIQGAASDFTQLSMVTIFDKIMRGEITLTTDKRYLAPAYTVHDSIGFYVMPKFIHTGLPPMIEICSNPDTKKYFGFEMKKVNMKMSAEVGTTWGGLKDYYPDEDYTKWLN